MMKKVCVTGGGGYIASWLVKKLLCQGFTVHATLRNLNDDDPKVQLLKSFPGAETRLKLFEADIYRANEFEAAIQGCEFVIHMATPLFHTHGQKQATRVDATVDAAQVMVRACMRSGTVRRLIYTATVMAASPLKEDGAGFKDTMDESCWTPINLSLPYANDFLLEYTKSKTLAEKELLQTANNEMEIVTLACGLVGGGTLHPNLAGSMTVLLSPLTNDRHALNSLNFMEVLLSKIPVVHVEDVINAHIFCLEEASMKGRYLCANGYVSIADIIKWYENKYPEFCVGKRHLQDEAKHDTKWGSTILDEKGFKYQHSWERVLDDTITCALAKDYQYLARKM